MGLLIEKDSVNQLLYSEDLSQSPWTISDTTVSSNSTLTPNGIVSPVYEIIDNSTNTGSPDHVYQSYSTASTGWWVASVFVKAVDSSSRIALWVEVPAVTCSGIFVDLSQATPTPLGLDICGTPMNKGIQALANGWFRIWVAVNKTSGSSIGVKLVPTYSSAGSSSRDDTSTGSAYFWGVQLEQGSVPTSYIGTTATTANRMADSAYLSGTPLDTFYNVSAGTFAIDIFSYDPPAEGTFMPFMSMNSNSGSTNYMNFHYHGPTADNTQLEVNNGTSLYAYGPSLTRTMNGVSFKASFRYSANNFRFAVNNIASEPNSITTVRTCNRLNVGSNNNGSIYLNGIIKKIEYWNTALPDAQVDSASIPNP
jgi:hypothetical protein